MGRSYDCECIGVCRVPELADEGNEDAIGWYDHKCSVELKPLCNRRRGGLVIKARKQRKDLGQEVMEARR